VQTNGSTQGSVGGVKVSRWVVCGCMSVLAARTSGDLGTKCRRAKPGLWALASAVSPTFCILPGRVMTKLCGIASTFSSTNRTGRPACTTTVSTS